MCHRREKDSNTFSWGHNMKWTRGAMMLQSNFTALSIPMFCGTRPKREIDDERVCDIIRCHISTTTNKFVIPSNKRWHTNRESLSMFISWIYRNLIRWGCSLNSDVLKDDQREIHDEIIHRPPTTTNQIVVPSSNKRWHTTTTESSRQCLLHVLGYIVIWLWGWIL